MGQDMKPVYRYKATVARWVDGDTVDLIVDLGFHLFAKTRFRLYGINTPERGQVGYTDATQFAELMAPVGSTVTVDSFQDGDKYGRWLGVIYTDHAQVNEALVAAGLAVEYMLY